MKHFVILLSILSLTACGGGSGGSSPSNPGPVNPGNTNVPGLDDELTAAEQLFGQGNGTGATPTALLARTDNLGFDYLSFGAWGNIYNLKESDTTKLLKILVPSEPTYNAFISGNHLEFTTQQLETMQNWTHTKDSRVAEATYTGPAIMYYMPFNPSGAVTESDHGTMQLSFGQDIANSVLNFVMHNPSNNISLNSADDVYSTNFSEDMNNVVVVYGMWENNAHNLRVYHGYGSKQ